MKQIKDLVIGRKYKNLNNGMIYLVKKFTKDRVIFIVRPNEPGEFTTQWFAESFTNYFEELYAPKKMLKDRLSRDNK